MQETQDGFDAVLMRDPAGLSLAAARALDMCVQVVQDPTRDRFGFKPKPRALVATVTVCSSPRLPPPPRAE